MYENCALFKIKITNCDFYCISVNSKLKINVEAFIITSVIMTGIIVDVGFALLTD